MGDRIDNYGAEDKEKEALDVNKEKVKTIRDNLKINNKDWRELIESVSGDYGQMTQEKKKLVVGLNESTNELKSLLDLVCKIPKRKILANVNEENNDNVDDENVNDDGDDDQKDEEIEDKDQNETDWLKKIIMR